MAEERAVPCPGKCGKITTLDMVRVCRAYGDKDATINIWCAECGKMYAHVVKVENES